MKSILRAIKKYKNYFIVVFLIIYVTCSFFYYKNNRIARVISIIDGDTVRIYYQNKKRLLRLKGIDCFETSISRHAKNQSKYHKMNLDKVFYWGKAAKAFAEKNLTINKTYKVNIIGKDNYGRLLGYIYLDNHESLGLILLKQGYCEQMFFDKYKSKIYKIEYRKAEKRAKKEKIGIWSLKYTP